MPSSNVSKVVAINVEATVKYHTSSMLLSSIRQTY